MTTTAEKINQCCIKLDDWRDKIEELEEELQKLRSDNSKPTDPEPLECWVNVYLDGDHSSFHSVEAAQENATQGVPGSVPRVAVHLREVTPQDEQDRKDAARYRYYKTCRWRLAPEDPTDLDDAIDEVMESE